MHLLPKTRKLCKKRHIPDQWWSLETWSRSLDESRGPYLRVSVSKVSGLISVSKATGLEILNIAKNGIVKFLQFNNFCLLYFQVRNNQNRSEKSRKFEKNSIYKWWRCVFQKFRQNAQILMSRVSDSNYKSRDFWWSLGLKVLTRSRSRKLRSRLHHCSRPN